MEGQSPRHGGGGSSQGWAAGPAGEVRLGFGGEKKNKQQKTK